MTLTFTVTTTETLVVTVTETVRYWSQGNRVTDITKTVVTGTQASQVRVEFGADIWGQP